MFKQQFTLLMLFFSLLNKISTLRISKEMKEVPIESSISPIKYLQAFGWLSNFKDNLNLNSEDVEEAIKNFQTFAGINATGKIDPGTLRIMSLPRCGETDTDDVDSEVEEIERKHSRKKRFVLQGTRWKTRELRYRISKYTSDLPYEEIDNIFDSAFRQWENVANISFFRVKGGKVHIDIRFEIRYHGDEETFDGNGGTTAHAYFPVYGGGIHFDDDESWTHNSDWGVNLFQVATHEIGHALGLEHSNVQESVMAPFYRTYRKDFKLFQDDIDAIQALYGKRVLTICDDAKIDAATTMIDGNTYIFKGIYVYLVNKDSHMVESSPTAISVAFPGLPSNLDAAITRSNGISYFFKEDEIWRVTNMTVDTLNFPKKLSEFFPGIPTSVDAALLFSVDENIYFFKERQYWKFDHKQNPPVSLSYPKSLYDWPGIPLDGIDAAASLKDKFGNKFTYFFKGNQYWKFNDKSHSVYLSDPPYPKLISTYVFGCRM